MVLGEPQILGQMKQAVRPAESAGTLGLVLNRLFQRTFAVAKDVRTQTDIGSASISMAAAAVKLAERIFPSIARAAAAAHRRGRDDRARRDALRRAQARSRSRSPTARSSAASELADALRRRGDHAERAARAAARVRHRRHLHGEHAADPRQGPARARGQGAPPRADLHRRPRGAARRRARGRASSTTCSSTASTTSSNIVKDNLQIRKEAVAQAEADDRRRRPSSFLRWLEGRTVVPTITALHGHHDELRAAELERARQAARGRHDARAGARGARARPHQQVPARAARRR